MYYHAIIETTDRNKRGDYERYYELNRTSLDEIIELIVRPYAKNEQIYIDGRYIARQNIRLLKIKSSERPLDELRNIAQSNVARGIVFVYTEIAIVNGEKYVTDITKNVLKSVGEILKPSVSETSMIKIEKNKIFIVHGRDDLAKTEVARFIEKLGFLAVILHEQASSGKTIIEKIEDNTNVGFAIVLYTPCDTGGLAGEVNHKSRARQNVVFEHGYLIGKLGRQNVCALVKGDLEVPNDISGVVYVQLDNYSAWHIAIAKELRSAGYSIDMNKVF